MILNSEITVGWKQAEKLLKHKPFIMKKKE